MPFDDEPRTNHAYVAMKACAADLLSPLEARIMLFLIYPELNADKTLATTAELEQTPAPIYR